MDKAESKNQVVYGNEQECSNDANMDCTLRLFAYRVFEVPIQNEKINAANIESFAIESVRKMGAR